MSHPSPETVRDWLRDVPDPEIPVISVMDLGVVRDIRWEGEALHVAVTPTYSGCPATAVIDLSIETHLREKGIEDVRIERRIAPPWTTDWISAEGREKLRGYGIAPPEGAVGGGLMAARAARLAGRTNDALPCPRCGSSHTEEISRFGSTPCKASWRCLDCLEPFDRFKCI